MLTDDKVAEATRRLLRRIVDTAEQIGDRFPLAADLQAGRWESRPEGSWTDGFWPAWCWLGYELTGEERYRTWGLESGLRLLGREEARTHDIGFLLYYGAVPGWKHGGNEALRDLGLRAADRLVGMWHSGAGVIPVGAEAEVASGSDDVTIDCMMNLQLLWWASAETGNRRYYDIALAHAERSATWHPRDDGSCYQSVHFDPATFEPSKKHTHQGWTASSCWSRGLGWCCYGFLEAYRATHDEAFLEIARSALRYHRERLPNDPVTFNDYDDPRIPEAPRDTSAASILASAFVGLAESDPHADDALPEASRLLQALIDSYLTPTSADDTRAPGMLLHGCYSEPSGNAPNNELIWGDYYLLEALARWDKLQRKLRRVPG